MRRTGGDENPVAEFIHLGSSESRRDAWGSRILYPGQTREGSLPSICRTGPGFQKLNTYCRCELARVFHLENMDNAATPDRQGEGEGMDICEILIQPHGINEHSIHVLKGGGGSNRGREREKRQEGY